MKGRVEQMRAMLTHCNCIRLRAAETLEGEDFGCEDPYFSPDAGLEKPECEARTSLGRGPVRWRDYWEGFVARADAREPQVRASRCASTRELARVTLYKSSSCAHDDDCVEVNAHDLGGVGCRVWINRGRAAGVSGVVDKEREDLETIGCPLSTDECPEAAKKPAICAQGWCVPADWPTDCPQAMNVRSRMSLPYGPFDVSRSVCDPANKGRPSIGSLGIDPKWVTAEVVSMCSPCRTVEGPEPRCRECPLGRRFGAVTLQQIKVELMTPNFIQAQLVFDTPSPGPGIYMIEEEVADALGVPKPTGPEGARHIDLREGRMHFTKTSVYFVPFPANPAE